jgi:hypothetical protein
MTMSSLTTPSVHDRPSGMTGRVLVAATIVLLAGFTFLLGHVTGSSTSSPTRTPATPSQIYAPQRADYPDACQLSGHVQQPC